MMSRFIACLRAYSEATALTCQVSNRIEEVGSGHDYAKDRTYLDADSHLMEFPTF